MPSKDGIRFRTRKAIGVIFDAMNMFLGAVGLVTLALGGIGVINIMLVTVSERTREIGLRKALGATNRSILLQFFLEGILLTLFSGLMGMGFAAALMAVLGTQQGPGRIRSAQDRADVRDSGDRQPDDRRRDCGALSRAQGRDAAAGRSAAAGVDMFSDLFHEAYGAMRHNRRRTALTMLGMAWGIATVVMLLAYGDGFGRACANIFANFGTKLMILVPGRTSMQAGGQKAGVPIRFTMDDVDTLTTNLPQITHITPEVSKQSSIQFDTRTFTFDVTGNYPNVESVRALKLGAGPLLQHAGRDAARPGRGHRLRGQGETFLRTKCSGREHPHRWPQLRGGRHS